MSNSENTIEWTPDESYYSKGIVNQRILSAISHRGWQYTVKLIHGLQIPFSQLKIAEVGCGTGTLSLTFALLGASVTLIDSNERALKNANKIYKMYGCTVQCVKANILDSPPDELRESFDIAISGGLAEHFTGKNRARCILFHKLLLSKNGFTFIGVPNRLSPFYWLIRLFRQLTGTWRISLEIPYSNLELQKIATNVGLTNCFVLGNAHLSKDCKVYTCGVISAIVETLPISLQNKLRSWNQKAKKQGVDFKESDCIKQIKSLVDEAKSTYKRNLLSDQFSAGIILFGFN